MNTWTSTLAAAAALGLTACAAPYPSPPAGVATATPTVSTTTYGATSFSVAALQTCPSPRQYALSGFPITLVGASLGESAKRSAPQTAVEAGKSLALVAVIAGTTCMWSAGFTPRAGAAYDATLHATNNTCQLRVYRVLDTVAGAPRLEPEAGVRYRLIKANRDACA